PACMGPVTGVVGEHDGRDVPGLEPEPLQGQHHGLAADMTTADMAVDDQDRRRHDTAAMARRSPAMHACEADKPLRHIDLAPFNLRMSATQRITDRLGISRMSVQGRPLSPHLQIFRPWITWTLSITHRFAGLVLAVGSLFLTWWLIAAAMGPEAFATAQGFMGSFLGRLILFGFTAALFFHLLNGIRHLFWDAGYGFEVQTLTRSGWAVVIGAAVLTVLAWIVGYWVMP